MFQKLLKLLTLFWTVVIAVFVVHYAIQYIPQLSKNGFRIDLEDMEIPFFSKNTAKAAPSHLREAPANSNSLERLKIVKKYGMTIDNVSSCSPFEAETLEKDKRCKQPRTYDTSSQCTNGQCTMTVEFGNDVPKMVALCVKQGDDCLLKYFDVPQNPEVVGYTASFELTPEIKSQLGIQRREDRIKFENANGFSLEDDIYTVYYKSMPAEDNLLVNGQFKLKVKFRPAS